VFWLVSGFALLGLIASYLFACVTRAACKTKRRGLLKF
jgi:hypothetical protein